MEVTRLEIPRCAVKKYGNEMCHEPAEFTVSDGKNDVLVCGSHVTSGIKFIEARPTE